MQIQLTNQMYEQEVLLAQEPVLLDFYADWCMPCKMLATVMEEIVAETELKICKIDIDREPELAGRFQIISIPTLIAMSGGEEIRRISGVQDKDTIMDLLALTRQNQTMPRGDRKNA